MQPAELALDGDGFALDETPSHPAGVVYSGGFDAEINRLFLASVVGHPGGVAAAGGDPSKTCISGLRVFLNNSGDVYWMADSMSLPREINESERIAIQQGLENWFRGRDVRHVARLQDVPR